MVKRLVWRERAPEETADGIGGTLRKGNADLPAAVPYAGWKRETGKLVELSSERFPGSSPVWIWEE